MVVDVVVQNPQKSKEYEYEKKHVRRDSKNVLLLLLSFLLWCSDDRRKKYRHPYSMMHRRLPTAGIEAAPHYHKLLVIWRDQPGMSEDIDKLLENFFA